MNEHKAILLVEDDPRDMELTLIALERTQLAQEVVTFRDGSAVLDYVFRRGAHRDRAPGNPTVIFLDVKLPKVNGLEVLAQIKADEGLRNVPVVMLTSSREETDLARSYAMGANAYVVKPTSFPQYIKTIGDLSAFWALLNEPPPGSFRPAR